MDITVYDKLYEALNAAITDFNETVKYNVALAHYAPKSPQYPLILLSENRNVPLGRYYGSRERISSLGYTVEIYAKDKAPLSKQDICRQIMQFVVDFMQDKIGLPLISNNSFDREGTNGEIYRTVLVFQRSYYENKETFF